jgi:multiple sugar transport system permease protein
MPTTAIVETPVTRAVRQVSIRRGGLFAADRYWAAAFAAPYVAVFLIFVIYPIGYGLWLGSNLTVRLRNIVGIRWGMLLPPTATCLKV